MGWPRESKKEQREVRKKEKEEDRDEDETNKEQERDRESKAEKGKPSRLHCFNVTKSKISPNLKKEEKGEKGRNKGETRGKVMKKRKREVMIR